MCKGFIKLDRSIFEHWIFKDAEKFRAFIDIIQLARWKEEKLLIGNEVVVIPRGSYYTSELKLSQRWGWSRKKTREFLKLLENERMIVKKGTSKGTTLTVENYRLYQDEGTTKDTTKDTTKEHQRNIKGTSKEHQRNNEGYTKEEREEDIRNYKKDKEGEEEVPTLPHLSFPSQFHKMFFDNISEVSYKMWIEDSIINLNGDLIEIKCTESKKTVIESRYADTLSMLTGKKIIVKVGS